MSLRALPATTALAAWSLVVWTTRIRNMALVSVLSSFLAIREAGRL